MKQVLKCRSVALKAMPTPKQYIEYTIAVAHKSNVCLLEDMYIIYIHIYTYTFVYRMCVYIYI